MKHFILTAIMLLALAGVAHSSAQSLAENKIINPGTESVVITQGFKFTEGPLWLPQTKTLLFSDVPADTQYTWHEKKGVTIFKQPSGFANGNVLDKEGRIITARHDRTVVRTEKNGEETVIAAMYGDKKLNSPNDLTLHRDGSIYFSDPHFGLIGYGPKKAPEEQPYRGIYRLDTNGNLIRVGQELAIPNGLAFSPDYQRLYVGNTSDGNIYQYDVDKEGQLSNLRLFAVQPVDAGKSPLADGLVTDKKGNLYAASAAGVCVYDPSGHLLGTLALHSSASNVSFGGAENKTLFITAHDRIYTLETLVGK